MEIVEKDFLIKFNNPNYILYKKKIKKELSEDPKDPFKVAGYYSSAFYALKSANSLIEKDLLQKPLIPFKQELIRFKKILDSLYYYSTSIDRKIKKLEQEIYKQNF